MEKFFFSGSHSCKLDDKNRFVLPQAMRFGLVEAGKLEFTLGLGVNGCLSIYRKSDMESLVEKFSPHAHTPSLRKFFTLFFSSLHTTTCDKLGRILLPPLLKQAAKIESEIVVAGVLDRIEIWSQESYSNQVLSFMNGSSDELAALSEEAFSLLDSGNKHSENASDTELVAERPHA